MDSNSTFSSLSNLTATIGAVGALGTAAFGLVDSFKALPGGGISLCGFRFIRQTVLDLLSLGIVQARTVDADAIVLAH